jgi:predicted metal-dependent phosphoesterase TrpH
LTKGIDLHVHTSASDGIFSPEEIVQMANKLGLAAIAICDHDTTSSVEPAIRAAKPTGLKVVPGVELSTTAPGAEVHMLGYFVRLDDPALNTALKDLRDSREERARSMVKKLGALGIHVDWQRVRELAEGASVGRPHIARAMLEKGYITDFKEAFDKYIGAGGPAYVERFKVTPEDAISLVLKAGGLPVLAHPLTAGEPEEVVPRLKEAGLAGLEAYAGNYPKEDRAKLVALADKYGLIATGGSDFHGVEGADHTPLGGASVPTECLEILIALARQRGIKTASFD